MKARVQKSFKDVQTGKVRLAGDVFECTRERFSEINSKLDGYIEEVKEQAHSRKTKKSLRK